MAYRTQDSVVFIVSIIKVIEYVSEPAEGWGAHSKASEGSKCKYCMSFPYDTRLYYPSSSLMWDTIVLQFVGRLLGGSVVGLMGTSSKRAYATGCVTQICCMQSPCLCDRPLLTCTFTGDTQAQVWLSLCGVSGSWYAQGFVWALQASLVGMEFDSKCGFATPTILLGLLLALGYGVSFFGGIQHSPVQQWVVKRKTNAEGKMVVWGGHTNSWEKKRS